MVQFVYNAPQAVTEYRDKVPMGWYTTCDDAVCRNCAPQGFKRGDFSEWGGFEGWESPGGICRDNASDSVTHCCQCGAVIAHDLTANGTEYLLQAITEFISENGHNHNSDTLAQWWDAYYDTFDKGDLIEIIEQAMANQGVPVYIGPKEK